MIIKTAAKLWRFSTRDLIQLLKIYAIKKEKICCLEFLFQHCVSGLTLLFLYLELLNYDVKSKKHINVFFSRIFINPRISKRESLQFTLLIHIVERDVRES